MLEVMPHRVCSGGMGDVVVRMAGGRRSYQTADRGLKDKQWPRGELKPSSGCLLTSWCDVLPSRVSQASCWLSTSREQRQSEGGWAALMAASLCYRTLLKAALRRCILTNVAAIERTSTAERFIVSASTSNTSSCRFFCSSMQRRLFSFPVTGLQQSLSHRSSFTQNKGSWMYRILYWPLLKRHRVFLTYMFTVKWAGTAKKHWKGKTKQNTAAQSM